jgi:cytochrome c oxidase cbb3-type subunit III
LRNLFILIALCISAYGAGDPDPAAVKRGKDKFVATCGFCHGNDGTGSRAPDLVRSPLLLHDTNGETIGPVIRGGMPDDGMPAFPFTDAQISDIAAFLHAQALVALHSNRVPGDYPVAKLLTGNLEAGKNYFDGVGGCTKCHSVTGDLKEVGRRYAPIVLQSRILYPSGAKMTVTVTLPSGQKVEGPLISHDEFTVALRDPSGWYRSYALKNVKAEIHDPLEEHRALLHKYTDKDVHNLFAYLESLK